MLRVLIILPVVIKISNLAHFKNISEYIYECDKFAITISLLIKN